MEEDSRTDSCAADLETANMHKSKTGRNAESHHNYLLPTALQLQLVTPHPPLMRTSALAEPHECVEWRSDMRYGSER